MIIFKDAQPARIAASILFYGASVLAKKDTANSRMQKPKKVLQLMRPTNYFLNRVLIQLKMPLAEFLHYQFGACVFYLLSAFLKVYVYG